MLLHLLSDANYNLLGFNATYVFSFCPLACSGNGVCETSGHCTCSTGWHGDNCNIRDCSSYCILHGVCYEETQHCQCEAGFVGHSCDLSLNNHQGRATGTRSVPPTPSLQHGQPQRGLFSTAPMHSISLERHLKEYMNSLLRKPFYRNYHGMVTDFLLT
nr:PREDICTED: multiple epidermal growth factor-like domains protein 8 [Latimeria chalumnae]|eukprot:XP_014350613.1 PREDICTED: multiple epidermal growth factor-like domains protein 8 [Latimeria chalumnae]